jgi:hypothetical protein
MLHLRSSASQTAFFERLLLYTRVVSLVATQDGIFTRTASRDAPLFARVCRGKALAVQLGWPPHRIRSPLSAAHAF